MFFVLVVHADFAALDHPTRAQALAAPLSTWTRVAIEYLAIVSVNIFVLISGWFGIRATVRGFCKLLFQVAFISVAVYAVFVALGIAPLTWSEVLRNAVEVWAADQWFAMSYMVLYVLSPVLNSYVEKAPGRDLGAFILVFYALQTLSSFGYMGDLFVNGYSTLSFVGLYMSARWFRIHGGSLSAAAWLPWVLILVPWIADTVIDFYAIKTAYSPLTQRLIMYSNPLVVVQSIGFLMLFARMKPFVSPMVNFLSSGCFAVYLFNMNPWIYIRFKTYLRADIWPHVSGIPCLLWILAFLLIFFMASVMADKLVREPLWRLLDSAVSRRKHKA